MGKATSSSIGWPTSSATPSSKTIGIGRVNCWTFCRSMKAGVSTGWTRRRLIRDSELILEYPMIEAWTFGRVTLAGDAAHPMYPRGSNGAAQAVIDARTLADALRSHSDACQALKAYEAARSAVAAQVVRTNRQYPPDFINTKVEELVGDKPFDDLDMYITQGELRTLSDNYKRVAGFGLADVVSVCGI